MWDGKADPAEGAHGMTAPAKIWLEAEGRLLRLRLSRPKANIMDGAMIAALDRALFEHLGNRKLGAALLDAEGPNFSFGASVEEHLPDRCAALLQGFHRLILRLVEAPFPVLVAVRGQCLGVRGRGPMPLAQSASG